MRKTDGRCFVLFVFSLSLSLSSSLTLGTHTFRDEAETTARAMAHSNVIFTVTLSSIRQKKKPLRAVKKFCSCLFFGRGVDSKMNIALGNISQCCSFLAGTNLDDGSNREAKISACRTLSALLCAANRTEADFDKSLDVGMGCLLRCELYDGCEGTGREREKARCCFFVCVCLCVGDRFGGWSVFLCAVWMRGMGLFTEL